jgi:hypothetical protein
LADDGVDILAENLFFSIELKIIDIDHMENTVDEDHGVMY